jgi:hypothetical protein
MLIRKITPKTFTNLSDPTTKLYEQDWTEIHKLLLSELKHLV